VKEIAIPLFDCIENISNKGSLFFVTRSISLLTCGVVSVETTMMEGDTKGLVTQIQQ